MSYTLNVNSMNELLQLNALLERNQDECENIRAQLALFFANTETFELKKPQKDQHLEYVTYYELATLCCLRCVGMAQSETPCLKGYQCYKVDIEFDYEGSIDVYYLDGSKTEYNFKVETIKRTGKALIFKCVGDRVPYSCNVHKFPQSWLKAFKPGVTYKVVEE